LHPRTIPLIMKIMKLFGIRIRVHPTFLWLLVFLLLFSGGQTVVLVLVVFSFVVLHELSHSLVARAHGITVHDITLLPIGGMARLSHMPEDARTEIRIAVAGPAFNLTVAALAYGALLGLSAVMEAGDTPGVGMGLLWIVLGVNVALGLFNLLPAFPMDGGRILRALLSNRRGYLQATQVAARVGRWVAGGMAMLAAAALFNPDIPVNPVLLLLVALFIYVSGKREEMAVTMRHGARGLWQFFGAGGQPSAGPSAGPAPRPQQRGDVIDVEGRVRPSDDPAAAFRQLADEADSRLRDTR